eukprot:NODE_342_length_1759_cov_335.769006_g277_i0.p1 GENE.NODE_342_length_1759_cov_335.769006_g277_i0~~NODE_342_length_1759_cov_335.769006_g277_i0.p1  ORF type:complete len:477 (+),score=130.55 NODE_342_length_1759_cov_335.769006_g277_i0:67-1497(+)
MTFTPPLRANGSWKGVTPQHERRVRDVCPAIFFVLAVLAAIGIGAYGIWAGRPCVEPAPLSQSAWTTDAVAQLHQNARVIAVMVAMVVLVAIGWVIALWLFAEVFMYASLFLAVLGMVLAGLSLVLWSGALLPQVVGGALLVGAVIVAVVVFALRNNVTVTSIIIAEGCQGLVSNCSLVLLITPIVFCCLAVFAAYLCVASVFLLSIPNGEVDGVPDCRTHPVWAKPLFVVLVVVGLWVYKFWCAVLHTTCGTALQYWHFTMKEGGEFRAFHAFRNSMTYSIGSMAFGGGIVALITGVQLLFLLVQKAFRRSCSKCVCAVDCCACIACSACTLPLQWITRYAFIYVGIYGTSFLVSARNSGDLISRSGYRLVLTNVMTTWLLLLGNLFCTGAVVALSVMGLGITGVGVLVLAVLSLLAFHFVVNLIRIAADTILVCYFEEMVRSEVEGQSVVSMKLREAIEQHKQLVDTARMAEEA